jgi:hypothetical protein
MEESTKGPSYKTTERRTFGIEASTKVPLLLCAGKENRLGKKAETKRLSIQVDGK